MKTIVRPVILEPADPKYLDRQDPITEATAVIKSIDGKSVLFLYPLPTSSHSVLVAGEAIETWRVVRVKKSRFTLAAAMSAYRRSSHQALGTQLDISL